MATVLEDFYRGACWTAEQRKLLQERAQAIAVTRPATANAGDGITLLMSDGTTIAMRFEQKDA